MPHVRSPQRLDASRSALLVIDVQEKLAPLVQHGDSIQRRIVDLTHGAERLGVPYDATVQYPRGLGPLTPPIAQRIEDPEPKLNFSAAACRRALDAWVADDIDQIVCVGIETHVCVLQTVLDLIAEGLQPFVVSDAVSARAASDHETAIERMRDNGATITTTESVLFEWLGTADRPEFKDISRIVKGRSE